MNSRAPILARLAAAGRALLAKAPSRSIMADIGAGSALDFQGGGFYAHRRMAPAEVRFVLEQAAMGSLDAQWDLFALMEDSWPRLAKNLAELRRAAARATYTVQPYARKGGKPTATASDKAAFVEDSIKQWWPKPGTLELGFEDTLFHALDAYGKGVSALEIHWRRAPEGIVPRCAHVLASRLYAWNETGTELGLRTRDGKGWLPFAQDHFLVGIWQARTGAPGATAVLRALAPYWAGITFGWEWLLSNAQIFGVPFRWASYDRNDPGLASKLRDMLAQMGACGYGAFPDGTKLEFKEVSQNVTGNPQVVIQELANQACDLLILGQELSGKAQAAGLGGGAADLQGSVRADRLADVTQCCADLLSYQLVPAILRANWGSTDEPPLVVPGEAEENDAKKLAERDQILLTAGVAMPLKWFYERHKIPEPVGGEAVIGATAPPPPKDQPDLSDPSDQTDPEKEPPVKAKAGLAEAHTAATDALYDARAIALLSEAERAALAPLLDALAWLAAAPEAHAATALKHFQDVLDRHAPAILANTALASAWEKVLAPAAVEGASETIQTAQKA